MTTVCTTAWVAPPRVRLQLYSPPSSAPAAPIISSDPVSDTDTLDRFLYSWTAEMVIIRIIQSWSHLIKQRLPDANNSVLLVVPAPDDWLVEIGWKCNLTSFFWQRHQINLKIASSSFPPVSHLILTAEVHHAALQPDCCPGGDLQPLAPGVQDGVIVLQLQPPLHIIIAIISILLISIVGVIVIVIGAVLRKSWHKTRSEVSTDS